MRSQETMIPSQTEPQPQNTIVEDISIAEAEQRQAATVYDNPVQSWVTQVQNVSDDMRLHEDSLDQEEVEFWRELQEKYLKPLSDDKERQKEIANDLRHLRNKISFVFFILNGLWLVAAFTLQVFDTSFTIVIPIYNHNLEFIGKNIDIDPIGFMFILGFAVSVLLQFFGMLYHRICTLIHYVAFMDTEPREEKSEQHLYLPGQKNDQVPNTSYNVQQDYDNEDSDDDDDDVLYTTSYNGATLV
nr:PREDICTED: uncharacterized protein LOC103368526 [Stegastes partitus]